MIRNLVIAMTTLILCACQKGPLLGPGDDTQLATAYEASCGYVQNSLTGQRVSWNKKIPVELTIHQEFPPEYKPVLSQAAKYWSDAAGMTLFTFSDDDESATKSCGPGSSSLFCKNGKNDITWNIEWPEEKKAYQGLTSLSWKGDQLTEADFAINFKNFNFFTGASPANVTEVHLESLLVHELGHVLGLAHRSNVPSVMWPILKEATIRTTLEAADIETLKCEY